VVRTRPTGRPRYLPVAGVYALLVALVGGRAAGVLPDSVLLLYVPAVAAAQLGDALLHNALGVTRSLYYPLVLLFGVPYAVAVVAVGRGLAARLRE
jgi:hypothetical protein